MVIGTSTIMPPDALWRILIARERRARKPPGRPGAHTSSHRHIRGFGPIPNSAVGRPLLPSEANGEVAGRHHNGVHARLRRTMGRAPIKKYGAAWRAGKDAWLHGGTAFCRALRAPGRPD